MFLWTGSALCSVVSFVPGVFLDVDHFFDYYKNHPFTLDLNRIYTACAKVDLPRLYLLLHSIEFVALSWAVILIFDPHILWVMAAIGYTQHMTADILGNGISQGTKPLFYSLVYRMAMRFDSRKLFRKG